MNKELQDHVWKHCLPKEFKEEVKKEYAKYVAIDMDDNPNLPAYAVESATSRKALLELLFGINNLTSDAEGEEEMLRVSRKKVRNLLNAYTEGLKNEPKSSVNRFSLCARIAQIKELFGSKCLPDEEPLFSNQPENYNNENLIVASENKPTEPKFKVGDKVRIVNDWHYGQKYRGKTSYITHVDESDPKETYKVDIYDKELGGELWYYAEDLEPCTSQDPIPPISGELKPQTAETQLKEERTEPTCTDDCPSPRPSQHFDDIISRDFADHNRLHIAAMLAAGLLANPNPLQKDGKKLPDKNPQDIAVAALCYADKLIKHAKKGGQDA